MFINKFGNNINASSYRIDTKKTYKALRWSDVDNAYDADNTNIIHLANPTTVDSAVNKAYVDQRLLHFDQQTEHNLNTNFVTKNVFNALKENVKEEIDRFNLTLQFEMKHNFFNSMKMFEDKSVECTNLLDKFKTELTNDIKNVDTKINDCQRQIISNIESEIVKTNTIFLRLDDLKNGNDSIKRQLEYNNKRIVELSEQCARTDAVNNSIREIHESINKIHLLLPKSA